MAPRLLASACLLVALHAAPAGAQQREVLRAQGEVTGRTFAGLAAFVSNATDEVIGLRLRFDAGEGEGPGSLSATMEGDLFVTTLRDGDTQISARGVDLQNGAYVVDGFYVVKSAGFHQGIAALYLEPQPEATVLLSGVPIRDVAVERLDPSIRKD